MKGLIRLKRTFPAFVLAVVFLAAFAFAAAAGQIDRSLEEYKLLSYKLNTFRQAFDPASQKISPALEHMRDQYQGTVSELDLKRDEIAALFAESVRSFDTRQISGVVAFVNSVPASDPSAASFARLRGMLLAKINFELVSSDLADSRKPVLHKFKKDLESGVSAGAGTAVPSVAPGGRPGRPGAGKKGGVPIYVSFHWHMHQPIYWPYEDMVATHNRGVYSYSLLDLMYSREGPYTSWPYDAVRAASDAGLANAGAQVSFSGSLIEDLNALKKTGRFNNWEAQYRAGRRLKTARGNPRLDMVSFGFHHPLMALIDYHDMRKQIQAHRRITLETFGSDVPYSKGIFPPENAFAEWMIPALVDEGLEWVFVDNIHFSRACKNYPWVKGENLMPPNPADQRNADPGSWVQLSGLWAPSKVTPFANRPYYVVLKDPVTGQVQTTPEGKPAKMIAVPTDRYMGNEDGRGGFGALNYDSVMSQLASFNTDPKHPLLIVLHHDGDNYGGGSYGYYHDNFSRFVEWAKANNQRFVATTVQDYLDMFPPDPASVIHVENGSWAGADNGDPEFLKWNGDPDPKTGYSPDRNSWGVMTAAKNYAMTAEQIDPNSESTRTAWRYMLVAQTSCYEYWDGTEMWDSHPTRASNLAVAAARSVIDSAGEGFADKTPPTVYKPQREPYNPGGMEWGDEPKPSEFTVWTYAYDVSGLKAVNLQYAVVPAGGEPVGSDSAWARAAMAPAAIPAQTSPKPAVKAAEYSAKIAGAANSTYAYRVEAVDKLGNVCHTPTQYVFVGRTQGGGQDKPCWSPQAPDASQKITIVSEKPGKLHWGVNNWTLPAACYWPAGSEKWSDGKSIETPLAPSSVGFAAEIGPFDQAEAKVAAVNFVFHYTDGSWSKDKTITVRQVKK